MDRAKVIFGNEISDSEYAKSCRKTQKYRERFGDDSSKEYFFTTKENAVLSDIGTKELVLTREKNADFIDKNVIVANIRMGYGHYRIAMAICSCANALGFSPLWLDFNAFPDSTATKLISYQNDLYSKGSVLSQKIPLFNKLVWEPVNSEGFRRLTYNSADQKNAELLSPLVNTLPKDIPFLATHTWTAQAAIHAGFSDVVNVIPDNWPMGLHLAEGSIHTVQTPSAFIGYKMLRGMDKKRTLKPMPEGSLYYTGHYVDHEIVVNIENDCRARMQRKANGQPMRFLLSVGGAGAQQKLFRDIISYVLPLVKKEKAVLFVNVGDHMDVWHSIVKDIPQLDSCTTEHFDGYESAKTFIENDESITGVHVFSDSNIFAAVYITNLLMRKCDVLLTKPGELSFYPVPKIMIHRVGGHEAWGAIRAAEVGDGTYEVDNTRDVLAVIDELINGREILQSMCSSILRAKAQGIYNGGYKAVMLATQKNK